MPPTKRPGDRRRSGSISSLSRRIRSRPGDRTPQVDQVAHRWRRGEHGDGPVERCRRRAQACTTAATASGSAPAASPTCRTPAARAARRDRDAVLAGQPVAGGQHRPDTGQGRGHLQPGAAGLERQPAEAVRQGVVVAGTRRRAGRARCGCGRPRRPRRPRRARRPGPGRRRPGRARRRWARPASPAPPARPGRPSAASGQRDGDDPARRRQRVQPERRLGDDAEGAEGAGEQLAEVVAGDVLDDPAAGLGHHPVGAHEGDADEQVPGGAVEQPARPAGADREGAADGRRRRRGRPGRAAGRRRPRVSCSSLTGVPARTTTTRSPAACSTTPVHRRGVQQQVGPGRRARPSPSVVPAPRATTARSCCGGHPQDLGDLLGGRRRRDVAGPDPADRVLRAAGGRARATFLRSSRAACSPATSEHLRQPGLLQRVRSLVPARAPRRTAAGSGRPCPGWPGRAGRTRSAASASCRGRRRCTSAACTSPCRCRRRARR